MIFTYSFYAACLVCIAGIAGRIRTWFLYQVGPDAGSRAGNRRAGHAMAAVARAVFGPRFFRLAFAFAWDVMLQARILKNDPLRWTMHFSMFAGFMALLFMHALDDFVSQRLFSGYVSTLNPYLFLRNLFGVLVLAGLAIAAYRRRAIKGLKRITGPADRFALALLLVIMTTGFSLEAAKIISRSEFESMVVDFAGYPADSRQIVPLKAYWAEHYGVAFADADLGSGEEIMEQGRSMHESYCAYCHANPRWAFISYPVSRAMAPAAGFFDRVRLDVILWYVHFMACFAGLALLPFTKFFHIVSTPLSLLANAASGPGRGDADPSRFNRRALDLDGCTHCGACSLHCSVAPLLARMQNPYILPSERLAALKNLAAGKQGGRKFMQMVARGAQVCTKCYRCTALCPAGIDLQDIWLASERQLADLGFTGRPARVPADCAAAVQKPGLRLDSDNPGILDRLATVCVTPRDFTGCLRCRTCTNACPVVDVCEDPSAELDLLPHQVMHALGLGLAEVVLGSRMIWSCTTCYACQEHCPQGVKITDIFYGLKNLAHQRAAREETTP